MWRRRNSESSSNEAVGGCGGRATCLLAGVLKNGGFMLRNRHVPALLALAVLMASVACSDRTLAPTTGNARLAVGVSLSGTIVATVIVDVTAPDIPTPLVFNIP